jgi:hypothetical protein
VEMIGRVMANSRVGKWVTAKVRKMIEQVEVGRLKMLCIALIVVMLVGDTIVLLRSGGRSGGGPDYSGMRSVKTAGTKRRSPESKGFGPVWDSLMADPETKRRWDSLVQVRPGLKDTVRWLERMDSAAGR